MNPSSGRRRVAHIITMLELGGAQQNTLYTVEHLDPRRFEVYLVCHDKGILLQQAAQIAHVRKVLLKALRREVRPWWDLLALWQLWRFYRREKIDIVHTHSSKAGILGRVAAWLAGVPVIIHTIHGFGFHDYQAWPVRKIYIWLERLCAFISQQLVGVAYDNIQKGLKENIGKPELYRVIRSGIKIAEFADAPVDVPTKRQELGLPDDARVVGQIGNFKPQKSPLDFVHLAAKVAHVVPNSFFLMIGDGELRPEITHLICEYGLEKRIILTGWRHDVAELLKTMDVVALTSKWEGLPRVYLQAMAARKPVVGTAVDGGPEAIKNGVNGYLFPPGQIEQMAEKIIELLQNEPLRQQMGQAGYNLLAEFDIDLMVRQQEEMYDALWKRHQ